MMVWTGVWVRIDGPGEWFGSSFSWCFCCIFLDRWVFVAVLFFVVSVSQVFIIFPAFTHADRFSVSANDKFPRR